MAYCGRLNLRLLRIVRHHEQFRLLPELLYLGISQRYASIDHLLHRHDTNGAHELACRSFGSSV